MGNNPREIKQRHYFRRRPSPTREQGTQRSTKHNELFFNRGGTMMAPTPYEEDIEVYYIECHNLEIDAIEGYLEAGGY